MTLFVDVRGGGGARPQGRDGDGDGEWLSPSLRRRPGSVGAATLGFRSLRPLTHHPRSLESRLNRGKRRYSLQGRER